MLSKGVNAVKFLPPARKIPIRAKLTDTHDLRHECGNIPRRLESNARSG